jgi:hypothetical protein
MQRELFHHWQWFSLVTVLQEKLNEATGYDNDEMQASNFFPAV